VVTAVITATVTYIVKSLLDGVKSLTLAAKIKTVAKRTFTKTVLTFLWYLLGITGLLMGLIGELLKKGPLTRGEVMYIVAMVISCYMWVMLVAVELGIRSGRKSVQPRISDSTSSPT
jgi:uncharacterized membrane protein YesL